eukprot:6187101-Pleurochrysis_carterae.AAC.2
MQFGMRRQVTEKRRQQPEIVHSPLASGGARRIATCPLRMRLRVATPARAHILGESIRSALNGPKGGTQRGRTSDPPSLVLHARPRTRSRAEHV